jgi:hypothetical protein
MGGGRGVCVREGLNRFRKLDDPIPLRREISALRHIATTEIVIGPQCD